MALGGTKEFARVGQNIKGGPSIFMQFLGDFGTKKNAFLVTLEQIRAYFPNKETVTSRSIL